MGSRTRYLIALALAAPVCAEIVNGSTSLSEIERPFATLFTLLPYSLLAIWLAFVASSNAPGNVLYLLPILGLVIEGLGTHSFFDSAFADLSTLAGIGVFAGVQWPWTLSLLASHAFAGFVVPLTLAAAIARPGSTAVTERTARIASITLVFILVLGWLVAPSTLSRHGIALTATLAVIALLILSAHKTRIPAPAAAVWAWPWFLVAGLAFVPLNWLTSLFLAQRIGAYAVLAQLLFLSAYLYFLWRAFFNPAASERRRMAFIAGYLVPHAIVLCLLGAIDIQRGIVGG
ncbi:MAG TPA: hypothetical protein VJS66_06250, partial [Burkholderiales bacterium]|nr:hypothetical protein [Burkholderiales bacterium]